MIKFRCEHCNHKLGVPETYVGRIVRCPNCKAGNRVPEPEADLPEAGAGGVDEGYEQPEDDGLGALAAAAAGDAGGFSLDDEPEPEPAPAPQAAAPESPRPSAPQAAAPAPAPAPAPSYSPRPASRRASAGKGKYGMLTVGGIMFFIAAGLAVGGALLAAVGLLITGASGEFPPGMVVAVLMAALYVVGGLLYGVMLAAMGVAMFALRDAARNTWDILARIG